MVRLVMILLGVDYLRTRWRGLMALGLLSIALGVVIFADALDGALYFPITPFACLLLLEGLSTLAVAWTGMGGQRTLRYVKGLTFCVSAGLVLIGGEHGNFILSMIFGTLFLVDGALQIISAKVVRYRTWRLAMAGGMLELAIAIFFYQPYPDHYAGTVAYCVAFGLFFGGWNMILLAQRVRRMAANPAIASDDAPPQPGSDGATPRAARAMPSVTQWDGPPEAHEPALTVHVWTPVGTSKVQPRRQLIVDRYIAAVDKNGAISTGHAALESAEGVYISLYPAVETTTCPASSSPTTRRNRRRGARRRGRCASATTTRAGSSASGRSIAATRPTISRTATVRARWRRRWRRRSRARPPACGAAAAAGSRSCASSRRPSCGSPHR
jgi:uncharacterized membrane protein HdeD (DUF308 family)